MPGPDSTQRPWHQELATALRTYLLRSMTCPSVQSGCWAHRYSTLGRPNGVVTTPFPRSAATRVTASSRADFDAFMNSLHFVSAFICIAAHPPMEARTQTHVTMCIQIRPRGVLTRAFARSGPTRIARPPARFQRFQEALSRCPNTGGE